MKMNEMMQIRDDRDMKEDERRERRSQANIFAESIKQVSGCGGGGRQSVTKLILEAFAICAPDASSTYFCWMVSSKMACDRDDSAL